MNSLFYLTMLIGVGWLMIWAILPPEHRGKGWWPFDMRDDDAQAGEPAGAGEARTARAETQTSAPPSSWRERRDRALSSRRGA